jgi:hypothetical protein
MKYILNALICAAALLAITFGAARAQTDEIQVYTGEIVEPGHWGLTLHNNYTSDGLRVAAEPGGIVPHHALNGVPEFAYGVTDWFEAGAYIPVYTVTGDGKFVLDSVKLRALFVAPHNAEREVFYGVNFELSYNARRWDSHRISAEMRPIIGVRFGPVDVVFNPILDTSFDGLNRLDFAPAARVDYNISPTWTVAVEHYADFGPLRQFNARDQQDQTLFAVIDYNGKANVEFGVGHGLTAASNNLVVKLMIAFDL